MYLEDVKRVLEGWNGTNMDDAQDIIKGYATGTEFTEEFVEHYLGKELYERLETMTIFFKKFEALKRDLH
tara:strand:- start:1777 stop:1986 length:210 start_codon:yes stop_codon:yes gene_type:complete